MSPRCGDGVSLRFDGAENGVSNFGRQPSRKTFELFSYLKKSCLIHLLIGGHRPPPQKRIVDLEQEKRKPEIIFLPFILRL